MAAPDATIRRVVDLPHLLRALTRALVAGAPCLAAPQEFDLADQLFEPWRWRSFGTDDGLLHERVRHVLETADGTVWVGTDGGLCGYDGYRFRPAHGLPHAPTASLVAGPDGTVGVVFLDAGAWIGDARGFARCSPAPTELDQVQALTVEASGTWVGLAGDPEQRRVSWFTCVAGQRQPLALALDSPLGGLHFHRSVGRPGAFVGLREGVAELRQGQLGPVLPLPIGAYGHRYLVEPEAGRALAIVQTPWALRGLWDLGGEAPMRVADSEAEAILALGARPNGEALVVLRSGRALQRSPARVWRTLRHIPEPLQDATTLAFRPDGDLWVGRTEGLALLRRASERWTYWRLSPAGERETVHAVEADGSGGHWLATDTGLEHRTAAGATELFQEALGTRLETLTALARDRTGGVWVGSGGAAFAGVRLREPDGSWRTFGPEEGLGALAVHQLRLGPEGELWALALPEKDGPSGVWVGGRDGFEQRDPCGGPGLATRYYDVAFDPAGDAWVASDRGIVRTGRGKRLQVDRSAGLRASRVYTLASDGAGGVWFGHQSSSPGLGHVDAEGRVRYITPSDESVDPNVTSLAWEPNGRLWVGATNGLLSLAGELFQRVDRRNGLARSHVNRVAVTGEVLVVGLEGSGACTLPLKPALHAPPVVEVESIAVDGRNAEVRWRVASWFNEDPRTTLHVRTRLDGGPWSPWSHRGAEQLHGLDYGSHHFEVEVASLFHRVTAARRFDLPNPQRALWFVAVPLGLIALTTLGAFAWTIRRRLVDAVEHRELAQRFEQLAGSVRDLFWLTDWRERQTLYVSPAFEALFGFPRATLDTFGANWIEHVHPEDRAAVTHSYAYGITRRGFWERKFRVIRPAGRVGWIHAKAFAIRGDDGRVARVAGVAEDVTERREAEEHQTRLSLELDHRVKNSLAQVTALAEQTLRATGDLESFRAAFLGRLRALGRTHEALASSRWHGVPLAQIIARTAGSLAPAGRLAVDGPTLVLNTRASAALGLALHELATNALKYGALRPEGGTVLVAWRVDDSGLVTLEWSERPRRVAPPPRRTGFGTSLVRGLVEHELGGAVRFDFGAVGFECTFELPNVVAEVLPPGPRPKRQGSAW